MLVTSKYKAGDVVVLKVSTGEEVFGRFVSQEFNKITLAKPRTIVVTEKGVALAPYVRIGDPDAEYEFELAQIVTTIKAVKELADDYLASTSKIVKANTIPAGGLVV